MHSNLIKFDYNIILKKSIKVKMAKWGRKVTANLKNMDKKEREAYN